MRFLKIVPGLNRFYRGHFQNTLNFKTFFGHAILIHENEILDSGCQAVTQCYMIIMFLSRKSGVLWRPLPNIVTKFAGLLQKLLFNIVLFSAEN